MKFSSKTSTLELLQDKVVFRGKEYSFTGNAKKINFGNYSVKIRGHILTLIDETTGGVQTLFMEDDDSIQNGNDVYVLKTNTYITKNNDTIVFGDNEYKIKQSKKIGSTDAYICEAGILEIPTTSSRMAKWNGVQISKLKK
jgi:hypothetical protein